MSKKIEETWQGISEIVVNYPILECQDCALAVIEWLRDNGVRGKLLCLRTTIPDEIFIISQRHGFHESITENGKHYGIEVFGKVFDNLSANGLYRGDWVADFDCASGQLLIEEILFF
jgi:hypothetical protein